MGTFVLKTLASIQYGGDWSDPDAYTKAITNAPTNSYGTILVALNLTKAELYLDADVTPTSYDDLPDDFGITSIDLGTEFWVTTDPMNSIELLPPIVCAGDNLIFAGGVSQFDWRIFPVNLYNIQINGISSVLTDFVDPYLGGTPPVPTKWNGFLETLLSQGALSFVFARCDAFVAPTTLNVSAANSMNIPAGDNNLWELRGVYDSYPPPPEPVVVGVGGIDLGGSATIQVLSDASGIYTLVEGQYHDELYERTSTTTSTTVSVQIPMPFFKTGYIGGR